MWHIRAMLIAMAAVCFFVVPSLRADSLQLKNGNFVQGKYLGGTERAVQFQANGKIRLYDIDEILSISFSAASADGGIPSNDEDPKPSTNTALNFKDRGGLRTSLWNSKAAQKEKQGSSTTKQPARQAAVPASSRTLLETNSKIEDGSFRKIQSLRANCAQGCSLPLSY
jgi:hypothetical protein